MKKQFAFVLLIVVIIVLATISKGYAKKEDASRLNVILIVTDDQWYDSTWAMPITQEKLWDRSTVFTNAYVTTPQCCPSRASMLTGQYGHTSGVLRNNPPYGGYSSFNAEESLAVWLDRAGYQTMMLGKYLVGYTGDSVPAGWDMWSAFVQPGYYRFSLTDGAVTTNYEGTGIYSTDLLVDQGINFIRNNQDDPFFLQLVLYAPHGNRFPKIPEQDSTAFEGYTLVTPNFNELDVSDKPAYIQQAPLLDEAFVHAQTLEELRTLPAADRAIGKLITELETLDLMESTIIIFLSDNGQLRGSHRVLDKFVPYEEAVHVPFSIYLPEAAAGINDSLVLNIDIAPTVLSATGVNAPSEWQFDGKDLTPILLEKKDRVRTWFFIEQLIDGWSRPSFWGIHTEDSVYWEYSTGEREFYDLTADPYQLENLYDDPTYSKQRSKLEPRLTTIRDLMRGYLP